MKCFEIRWFSCRKRHTAPKELFFGRLLLCRIFAWQLLQLFGEFAVQDGVQKTLMVDTFAVHFAVQNCSFRDRHLFFIFSSINIAPMTQIDPIRLKKSHEIWFKFDSRPYARLTDLATITDIFLNLLWHSIDSLRRGIVSYSFFHIKSGEE